VFLVKQLTPGLFGMMSPAVTRFQPSQLWLIALVLAPLVCIGCAGKETAQVSGRVQYKGGKPIEAGIRVIRFEPAAGSSAAVRKTASGNIEPDGSFELFTRKPGDGVPLGKYTVTFTILSGATGGESLIKPEYNTAEATPFTEQIDTDRNDLLYEIEPK
jgi:hypothetical protein